MAYLGSCMDCNTNLWSIYLSSFCLSFVPFVPSVLCPYFPLFLCSFGLSISYDFMSFVGLWAISFWFVIPRTAFWFIACIFNLSLSATCGAARLGGWCGPYPEPSPNVFFPGLCAAVVIHFTSTHVINVTTHYVLFFLLQTITTVTFSGALHSFV